MSIIVHGKFGFPKFGFVHIPKTSGTTIKSWLIRTCHKRKISHFDPGTHSTLPELRLPDDYKSIAVIRNPWERLLSFYSFTQNIDSILNEVSDAVRLQGKGLPDQNLDFNDWVKNSESYYFTNTIQKPGTWAAHGKREALWYTPLTPMTIWLPQDPTILIRYENITVGLAELQELVGSEDEFEHKYKSSHLLKSKNYTEIYNDESRKFVEKFFALDIDRWNYKFGD